MYLQPIFGSPDIQQQMPQEGQQFSRVNRIFLKIMQYTAAHDLVMEATEKPSLLEDLQECNLLLTTIKQRVNAYLEKKRSAFPRFYFLSNDELLEILAETKEPLRVQPHLKKFFEGINKLEFDENKEIIGMESAEQEKVSFMNIIKPVDAKVPILYFNCIILVHHVYIHSRDWLRSGSSKSRQRCLKLSNKKCLRPLMTMIRLPDENGFKSGLGKLYFVVLR
jgi:hypothetical protein